MSRKIAIALLPLLLGGCARYQYQIVSPARIAGVIGDTASTRVDLSPLVYDFRTYENHLILRIENPTVESIQLMGDQSFVVSPDGQSHPLATQMIASHSFIKLILPPVQPPPQPSGPSITFGLGYTTGSAVPIHQIPPDPDNTYFFYIGDSDVYWEWTGQSDVRLELVFSEGQRTFKQNFVFTRRKV